MRWLILFALWVVTFPAYAQPPNLSSATVTATGGTTAITEADRNAQQINVKDYGAKGNALSYIDGTIAASASSFSSASATFTSSDVGKTIIVNGAGSGGGPLATTVSAFSDAHDISLTANSVSATGSGIRNVTAITVVTAQSGAGSYVPGDTVTMTGGTAASQTVGTVTTTNVVSATVNAAGSGGTTSSACILTGTTGSSTVGGGLFQVSATISGGAISAINSITVPGVYTTNPTSLTAEPVTSTCALTGATLTLKMGVNSIAVTTPGSYTSVPASPVAQGATSGSGTGATFSLVHVQSGNFVYGTDDGPSFVTAANKVQSLWGSGTPVALYAPGSNYLINSGTMPTWTFGAGIIGDGLHKTYITLGTGYSGPLFSWSEAWTGTSSGGYAGPSQSVTGDTAGPFARDITVFGNSTAPAEQDAFVFYGRNDFTTFLNVGVYFLNGQCLQIGYTTGGQTVAYMRESSFENFWCLNGGRPAKPAIEISSTTTSVSDASNEIRFIKLDVFNSIGVGVQVHNPTAFNSTRLVDFYSPRIEQSGADNLQIGAAGDLGQTNSIHIIGLQDISPGGSNNGFYGLNVGLGTNTQSYDAQILGGQIGPCISTTCYGLRVGNIRLAKFAIENISTAGTSVTYSSSAGTSNVLDGNGVEQFWTYNIAPTVNKLVSTPIYKYGDPTTLSFSPSVSAFYHDSSATFGNAPGQGAIDFQIARNAATQVASGTDAALVGGLFNTASGIQSGIFAGVTNVTSGQAGFIGGGLNATDRGRYSTQTFSSGQFGAGQAAQAATFTLRAISTSGATGRLTADAAAAGAANIVNILNANSYAFTAVCEARDTTTAGTDLVTTMPAGLLTRDASLGSTAIVLGTPASVSRGTVTGAGFAFTADTTNGGMSIVFTPPTGNNDTFHSLCVIRDAEVQ